MSFLSRLKEGLDSGKVDESIKTHLSDVMKQADKLSNPSDLAKITEKAEIAVDTRKPLTLEEITELNRQAVEQQNRIDDFELETRVNGALVAIDLTLEKLDRIKVDFFEMSTKLRAETTSAGKSKLIKKILESINNLEAKIEKQLTTFISDDNSLKIIDKNGRDIE